MKNDEPLEILYSLGNLTQNANFILTRRIYNKDKEGQIAENFDGLCHRVARAIGHGDEGKTAIYFNLLRSLDFMPNSPCLTNAGKERMSLSACFVLPAGDSIEEIFETIKNTALIHKSGGGCIGGESPVLTDHGVVNMKRLVESRLPYKVLSQDPSNLNMLYEEIGEYHTVDVPDGRVYEISFGGKSKIRVSDWHPFYVWRGDEIEEVRADALQPGDAIVGSTRWNGDVPSVLDEEAWFLGVVVSDAGFDDSVNGLRMRICKSYESVIKRSAKFLDVNYVPSSNPAYEVPVWELTVVGKLACHIRNMFGSEKFDCYGKRLPDEVWSWTPLRQLALLVGLIDGDGWFSNDKSSFYYGTVSERLADEVQGLARMLGIRSSRRLRPPRREHEELFFEIKFVRSPFLFQLMNERSARYRDITWGWTMGIVPLSRRFISSLLQKGIPLQTTEAWRKGIVLSGNRIAVQKWFLRGVASREVASLLLKAAGEPLKAAAVHSAEIVKRTRQLKKGDRLYDLTVSDVQTYMAGVNCAVVVHNTGFSGARIRPRGAIVAATGGVASGPVSLLFQTVNDTTEQIKQGSTRRGANMGVLPIWHPDILHFMRYKIRDGELKNFNISIAMTDKFMGRVQENPNAPHICRFGDKRYYLTDDGESHLWKEGDPIDDKAVTRKQIWDEIVKNAHANGDPGIFFIDTVNRTNAALIDSMNEQDLNYIESPNPCQPSWAPLLTKNGIRTLGEVDVGSTIWSGRRWTKISEKVQTGTKPVYAFRTRAGTFYGTENHRIISEGKKVEVGKAETIDINQRLLDTDEFCEKIVLELLAVDIMDGLVFGDGTVHKASGDLIILLVGKKDQDWLDSEVSHLFKQDRSGITEEAWEAATTLKVHEVPRTYDRKVPDRFRKGKVRKVRGFLRGLYSANGSIVDNRITLKASSFRVIEAVQEMLSSIGIRSYYTVNRAHEVEFSNGIYECKISYDLNITRDRKIFRDLIGFIQKDKQTRLDDACLIESSLLNIKMTYEIVEKEYMGEEPVFSITVEDEEHTYWTGGLLVSNCGEQPLCPYDACCLGSLNLSNFVKFDDENKVMVTDWDRLKVRTKQSVRFLNGVLDVNYYPIPQIREITTQNRKIGAGVMGWADMLIKLGIPYSSERAFKLGEEIAAFIETVAWQESFEIADERGEYPGFSKFDGSWARVNEQFAYLVEKHGHGPANMCITCIAPTGTISMIAGVSSGIEPNFAWAFVQRRIDSETAQIHPLVEEVLGKDLCFEMRIEAAQEFPKNISKQVGWMNRKLIPLMKSKGPQFEVASDIPVRVHLEHQASWQRHVTDGISKTISLARDATLEDVEEAYIWAWKNGLKGITVYREGSRKGEVLSTGLDELEQQESEMVDGKMKRPDVMAALIIRKKVEVAVGEYENVYITVGLLGGKIEGGKPYEVFLAGDPKSNPLLAQSIDSLTRLSSMSLRHGTPPNVVVQQLERIRGQHMFSMPRKVAQAIQYAMENTKDVTEDQKKLIDKCSEQIDNKICGGQLIFVEGCYKCLKCHGSKCG